MKAEILKENEINEMILNMMSYKNKEIPKKRKKKAQNYIKKESFNKSEIKSNVETFFKEQEDTYKFEENNTIQNIQNQTNEKEKELNDYYKYCQDFKTEYKNNWSDAMKQSEQMKKELKDLQIEYIDNKIFLENKRKMELESIFNFYKEKLLEIKLQWDNKSFCDKNIKNIIYDILGVID
ncbi:conserved protein, unknown function [Hepatocystis sp. ex Piliocolobus tephrosceles]|nr:conserved protein, unknown function [Hepatocystis sp. ex Piliocolobus tephrosceles]